MTLTRTPLGHTVGDGDASLLSRQCRAHKACSPLLNNCAKEKKSKHKCTDSHKIFIWSRYSGGFGATERGTDSFSYRPNPKRGASSEAPLCRRVPAAWPHASMEWPTSPVLCAGRNLRWASDFYYLFCLKCVYFKQTLKTIETTLCPK
jgi:hypothetical protein